MSLIDRLTLIDQGNGCDFRVDENGVMMFRDRVCVFDVSEFKRSILEEGHISGLSIHPGAMNMYQDLNKMFWWPGMKKEVSEFVYACLTCQTSKIEHQKPLGLMQPLNIPKCIWDSISMDFVIGLPKTSKGCNSIWVIMDRLTKSTHFVSMRINYPLQKLAELHIDEIMKLHGNPPSIMSDRDLRFTLRLWESL